MNRSHKSKDKAELCSYLRPADGQESDLFPTVRGRRIVSRDSKPAGDDDDPKPLAVQEHPAETSEKVSPASSHERPVITETREPVLANSPEPI